jgi:uncharacterized secreted protein with C-terminal beta-propeller domain
MVQKEVMKKTKTYGLIGLLLAILLVAMIYAYGNTQKISTSPQQTQVSPFRAQTSMKTFTSYDELKDYLNQSSSSNLYGNSFGIIGTFSAVPEPAPAVAEAAPTSSSTAQAATNDYSTTNIQVAGVDEADIVKTDGQYLYVIGNDSQVVYILDASSQDPQNARVLSEINLNNSYLSGIYLSSDGSKLVVLGSNSVSFGIYGGFSGLYPPILVFPSWSTSTNFVYVYDVSNKADPVLSRNFTMSGDYVDSRMIGNYVYDVISQNAYLLNGTVLFPTVFTGQQAYNIEPTSIQYFNTSDPAYMYTTIVALNVQDASQEATSTTILMGNAGSIYVSQSNIYLTDQISTGTFAQPDLAINPTPIVQPFWQGTSIYRIQISNSSLTLAAEGNVTGTVMNQYSMDEYNGYFRIATTSYDYNSTSLTQTQQNNVYVLNSDLQVVGKLENLASGETLDSARFIGDRCYLVTFNQIDPLFVVDLSQPTDPVVLGNLTIPGFSDFLQPYDATHLIGIGQDVNASIDANKAEIPGDVYYTAVLGLKVSLFDVSNVFDPKEISSIVLGDRGTTSDALTDPKAILFDASRNLLVLPVELYLSTNSTSASSSVTGTGTAVPVPAPMLPADTSNPTFVWQGVYIFNVTLANGITVEGNVTQLDNASAYLANPSLAITSSYPWNDSQYFITRSLYIGNVLYTVSQSRVQLNSLTNFALLAKVELN